MGTKSNAADAGRMRPFGWDDEMLTGVEQIDTQHRELVARVNAFLAKCAVTDCPLDELRQTFDYLRRYAAEHFDAEEALMVESGYPYLAGHKRVHGHFRAWVEKMAESLAHGPLSLNRKLEVNYYLVDWLENQFRVMDRRFTRFLREGPTAPNARAR